MSVKHKEYVRHLTDRYRNSLGWNQDMAAEAARVASDVLRLHYGGGSHYIPARNIDRNVIRSEYDGSNISALAREHGISAQTVRNLVR